MMLCNARLLDFYNKILYHLTTNSNTMIISALERLLPRKKINIDKNGYIMKSSLPYYLLALITFMGIFIMGGNPFLFIVIIYAILPLLDQVISLDWRNPNEQERRQLEENDIWFKLPLYLVIVLDWILFFKLMDVYSTYEITTFTVLNLMGIVFIVSNLNSVQFAVAH